MGQEDESVNYGCGSGDDFHVEVFVHIYILLYVLALHIYKNVNMSQINPRRWSVRENETLRGSNMKNNLRRMLSFILRRRSPQ